MIVFFILGSFKTCFGIIVFLYSLQFKMRLRLHEKDEDKDQNSSFLLDLGKQGCYCITLTHNYFFNAVNEAGRKKTSTHAKLAPVMEEIILIFTYDGGMTILHHSQVHLI